MHNNSNDLTKKSDNEKYRSEKDSYHCGVLVNKFVRPAFVPETMPGSCRGGSMKRSMLLLFIFIALAGIASAEDLYVQSVEAKIMAEPSFAAKTLAVAKRGDLLQGMERKGSWYSVIYNGTRGWVAKLLVADHKPKARKGAIQAQSDIGKKARRRASAVATAGAARGLAADDRRRASQAGNADYSALSYMESLELTEEEALDFMKQGIGE